MKRIMSILAAVLVVETAALSGEVQTNSAATEVRNAGGLLVKEADLQRNDQLMSVDMNLDLSELGVKTNRVTLFTPMLVSPTDTAAFPSFAVFGRNRWFYYLRNDLRVVPDGNAWRKKNAPEDLEYSANIPYAEWMNGAELKLRKEDCGCCGDVLDSAYYALTSYKIYEPSFLYAAVPERNVAKMRALEGNAYVDFPVSETVIYPDYHSNRSELEKIVAQIDSVRLDPDVSVKSIFIKGYASPESPYDNNTRLAKGRTEAIRSYVEDMYDFPDGLITTDYEPENWEELRAYVAASKLPSRKRILELIDKDEEPDRKEWLIKSRYKGEYTYLLENCYPYLRRTYYRIDYQIRTFTEADVDYIRELVGSAPQKLSLEEFYMAARGLDPQSEQFQEIFDVAVRMYPSDPVANLNAANVAMQGGDYGRAAKYIERAEALPEAVYARGVLAALEGDRQTAAEWFTKASELGISQAEDELAKL